MKANTLFLAWIAARTLILGVMPLFLWSAGRISGWFALLLVCGLLATTAGLFTLERRLFYKHLRAPAPRDLASPGLRPPRLPGSE